MSARRYLTIIQAAEGYPPGRALPDGPAPPVLHTVVLAERLRGVGGQNARLRARIAELAGTGGER